MTTDDETSPAGELTDKQLDQLLAAANTEILQNIEAAADPTHTLTAIMAQNSGTTPVIQGATGASDPEASQIRAAMMIGMRFTTHRLISALNRASASARALDSALARISDLDNALNRISDLGNALNLARALAQAHTLGSLVGRALDSAVALDLDLARASDLTRNLADALDSDLDSDRARDLARAVARARTFAFESVGALDRARALAPAHALALDRVSALGRASVSDIARALASAGDVARAVDLARASALARAVDFERAVNLAEFLARNIYAQQVDASGADLSEVRIEQLDALSGTIWTDQTIWPPDIEDQVRTHSEEIRPGVYQVRCGNEPDHSDLTSV